MPQGAHLDLDAQGEGPEKMMKKMTYVKDYNFVTEGQTMETVISPLTYTWFIQNLTFAC